jgi:hypothetical protein
MRAALLDLFYRALLWATQLEIALARSQPERNHTHLAALQRDEAEYQRALTRLMLNL